jgi:hypothetical protein
VIVGIRKRDQPSRHGQHEWQNDPDEATVL